MCSCKILKMCGEKSLIYYKDLQLNLKNNKYNQHNTQQHFPLCLSLFSFSSLRFCMGVGISLDVPLSLCAWSCWGGPTLCPCPCLFHFQQQPMHLCGWGRGEVDTHLAKKQTKQKQTKLNQSTIHKNTPSIFILPPIFLLGLFVPVRLELEGAVDGLFDGELEGAIDGLFDGELEGAVDGLFDGVWEGEEWTLTAEKNTLKTKQNKKQNSTNQPSIKIHLPSSFFLQFVCWDRVPLILFGSGDRLSLKIPPFHCVLCSWGGHTPL